MDGSVIGEPVRVVALPEGGGTANEKNFPAAGPGKSNSPTSDSGKIKSGERRITETKLTRGKEGEAKGGGKKKHRQDYHGTQ